VAAGRASGQFGELTLSECREYVNSLDELIDRHHVWRVGFIRPECVAGIVALSDDNRGIVLTQPRLAIRGKLDGRARFLGMLPGVLADPDEVHRDRHSDNAVFYKRLGERGYLKVILWLQRETSDKQHSIGDLYLKSANRVHRARGKWLVWSKK
jgi:hypothetical protein